MPDFDEIKFLSDLHRAMSAAADQPAPLDVKAIERTQGGVPILLGRCPKCATAAALSGEGRHLCRRCGTWLRYVKVEG